MRLITYFTGFYVFFFFLIFFKLNLTRSNQAHFAFGSFWTIQITPATNRDKCMCTCIVYVFSLLHSAHTPLYRNIKPISAAQLSCYKEDSMIMSPHYVDDISPHGTDVCVQTRKFSTLYPTRWHFYTFPSPLFLSLFLYISTSLSLSFLFVCISIIP